jgi:exosortase
VKSSLNRTSGFALLVLALMVGSWRPLEALVSYASDWDNTNASQVLVIPLITAFLLYWRRDTVFRRVQYDIVPGIGVMIAGVALMVYVRTKTWNLPEGDQLALSVLPVLIILWGGFLLFYGVHAFNAGLFPLLFLVFFLPIPSPLMDRTIYVLQHASAEVSYVLLKMTGTPIYKENVTFFLPDMAVVVAPQCSGIRSGISMLILCALGGNVLLDTWPRRVALVLAAIPILIFKNALRISTLSFLAVNVDQRILTSRLHQEGGIPFFVVGLLLMYPILRLLTQSEYRSSQPSVHT